METTISRITAFGLVVGMIILTALLLTQVVHGSAPSGLPAYVATTSTISVGSSTAIMLFPASSCSARVISTRSQAIMLSFATSTLTPSATVGHLQLASTTVVYDSGTYGCSGVSAFGYQDSVSQASTTVTLTETR